MSGLLPLYHHLPQVFFLSFHRLRPGFPGIIPGHDPNVALYHPRSFNMSIFAAVANASASAAPAAKVRAPRPVDDSDLLFNINLFLLCAVAVFVLSLLPRATIRFTHKREWVDGHFLRSSELLDEPAAVIRRPAAKQQDVISPISPALLSRSPHEKSAHAYAQEYKEKWASETDASHTYVSHADLIRKGSSASTTRFAEQPELLRKGSTRLATQADLFRKGSSMSTRERRRQNVPTHMPGVSTTFPRLASFLRTTIRPGLTIGKGCVLLGYFAIMLYAGLFKSNPLSDPLRTGFVAVSQIPAVVLLGTKHNLLGMVIGFGYERVSAPACSAPRMCCTDRWPSRSSTTSTGLLAVSLFSRRTYMQSGSVSTFTLPSFCSNFLRARTSWVPIRVARNTD